MQHVCREWGARFFIEQRKSAQRAAPAQTFFSFCFSLETAPSDIKKALYGLPHRRGKLHWDAKCCIYKLQKRVDDC
jgi:hypothetical protein